MLRSSALLCLVVFVLTPRAPAGPARPALLQRHAEKASPFDGLRWEGDLPEVLVEKTWYRPIAIQGVAVADILTFCDRRWRGQRQKRFGEDLVEAVLLMGHALPQAVTLELERVDDGRVVVLDGVLMTKDKRNDIRDAGNNSRRRESPREQPAQVSRDEARADIAEFRARLEDQFSYLKLRGVDLEAELEPIDEGLEEVVNVAQLAASLREVLMKFGDGHSGVRSDHDPRPERLLPFVLDVAGGGVVAYPHDRTGWLVPGKPFVHAIDGRPLDEWIDAVRPTIAAGSPQYVQRSAFRRLQDIETVRARLRVEPDTEVRVSLSNRLEGGDLQEIALPLASRPARAGPWPTGPSRLIEGDAARGIEGGVGYLRLAQMDDDLIPELHRWMSTFRETGGLIVDVRENGGGLRGLLLALGGYLLDEEATPVVGNVSAYRKSPQFRDDHLGGSRHLYRMNDAHWTPRQREAISEFAQGFEPEWSLPDGFSEWHYLVLDRTGHPDEYRYSKPVVVLCDAGCFSATDIFLGAIECLPQVTLVGRASGGGSARSQSFGLPRTGIEVRCASMASFRPNGLLYDGRGIEVDVVVDRSPDDLLRDGGDAQLDAALEALDPNRKERNL